MELNDIKLTPILESLRLEKIDDDIYFSKRYSNYISNSRLGLLNPKQNGTPEQFFAGFTDSGYSQALELGSAVHELVLQSDLFELAPDINKPTAKMGAMADALYHIYVSKEITDNDIIKASDKVNYYKDKMTAERIQAVKDQCLEYWKNRNNLMFDLNKNRKLIFLDSKLINVVSGCVNSLNNNEQVTKLLHPDGIIEQPVSEYEKTILLDVKAECPNGKSFILKLKSKLDNYTIDAETNTITVNDVKTIGKFVNEFDNNISTFHYNRELAMYLYLLKLCANKYYGLDNSRIKANYLVVSTIPNFYSKVRPMFLKELYQGFNEFKTLLRYAAYLIAYKGYNFNE